MVWLRTNRRPRRTQSLLTIAIAFAAIGGGVAFASIPDSAGVIHGCRNGASGLLRVIDDGTGRCTPEETALNWSGWVPETQICASPADRGAASASVRRPRHPARL
jgi:hypothetical protein